MCVRTAAASALDGIASPGIKVTCCSIAATRFAWRNAPPGGAPEPAAATL